MMSSISSDLNLVIDEHWLNFECEASMLHFVNPDEICPLSIPQMQPQSRYQLPYLAQQNQVTLEQNQLRKERQHYSQQHPQEQHQIMQLAYPEQIQNPSEHKVLLGADQQPSESIILPEEKYHAVCNDPARSSMTQPIGPPPVLVPRQDKVYTVQQQLDYRKALAKQRCEQLRARLNNEPLKYPPKVMKKLSGKKMTGRERLSELERLERNLEQQRDHLKNSIIQLEAKCGKLREILGNIVANSPEYNDEMIDCLKAGGLLIDSHIN